MASTERGNGPVADEPTVKPSSGPIKITERNIVVAFKGKQKRTEDDVRSVVDRGQWHKSLPATPYNRSLLKRPVWEKKTREINICMCIPDVDVDADVDVDVDI